MIIKISFFTTNLHYVFFLSLYGMLDFILAASLAYFLGNLINRSERRDLLVFESILLLVWESLLYQLVHNFS